MKAGLTHLQTGGQALEAELRERIAIRGASGIKPASRLLVTSILYAAPEHYRQHLSGQILIFIRFMNK